MPHSRPNLKPRLFAEIQRRWKDLDTPILDVGAGDGNLGRQLKKLGYTNVTALEVWEPYVEQFKLRDLYKTIIVGNVVLCDFFGAFRVAIFGDILEHLSVKDAQLVLERASKAGCSVLAIVPWTCKQGAWGGNPNEIHQQDDLTPKLMLKRYPSLKMLARDNVKGLYARIEKP